jgi:hypothetical protein
VHKHNQKSGYAYGWTALRHIFSFYNPIIKFLTLGREQNFCFCWQANISLYLILSGHATIQRHSGVFLLGTRSPILHFDGIIPAHHIMGHLWTFLVVP